MSVKPLALSTPLSKKVSVALEKANTPEAVRKEVSAILSTIRSHGIVQMQDKNYIALTLIFSALCILIGSGSGLKAAAIKDLRDALGQLM